ncbi:MAG: cytochrome c biogenesis protein CcsA [Deltaproteobacteria bacterium]|nr:cytochrome c biogenesis protein CcsA [Deltaproteobacteria bacterium]
MQEIGQLLLVVTFVVTLATAVTAIFGAVSRHPAWMRGARYGLVAIALLSVAMAAILTHGFLTHDFDNKYINGYSERAMPTVYLLAAFWGGEKGALLFWVTSLSLFSTIAVFARTKDRPAVYLSWVTAILAIAILFFLVLMVFETSPFETWMTRAAPDDGKGLNPLLQNPVMAFHPPSLLTGYILFTIPFAFGMAALIARKLDNDWIADTRRWTIVSWVFLSVGLLLGCRWAYMEIGWGFWWMWDSVENAGLIPWFTATAFLHSVMIQERRGMLKRWNVVLVALTFFLCIFGTFLTRSQLIVSIHSFADSKLPEYFIFYFVAIAIFSAVLIWRRWRDLRSESHIESMMSRESMFVLNNVILVFCAFITLYGTLMAKITESEAVRSVLMLDEPANWSEDTFNEIFVPTGIALLVILGIGPLISWRRATAKNFRKNFVFPLVVTSLLTALFLALGCGLEIAAVQRVHHLASWGDAYTLWAANVETADWISVITYWLCGFVLVSMAREFHVAARLRKRQGLGGYVPNLFVVLFKNPRRYGGYVVHFGIVFLFIAFTGKGFKHEEKDRLIGVGQTHVAKDWALTLVDRDHYYSDAEGCIINDATFVAMPAGTSVDEGALERLDRWLAERKSGPYHVKTDWDTPRMVVHFKEPSERKRLMTDHFLVRDFLPKFERVSDDPARNQEVWAFKDTRLVQSRMGSHAMDMLRAAREAFQQGDIPVVASLAGGSAGLTLTFADAGARESFRRRLDEVKIPDDVLVVLDEPEEGALAVVDRHTGQTLVPESRFYPSKNTTTTEVDITHGDFLVDVYVAMQPDMGGGKPYVKVFTVIFPLVNFLWIGALLMLLGSVICLTPRWLGRTLAHLVAGGREGADLDADEAPPRAAVPAVTRAGGGAAIVVIGVGLAALLGGSEARAQTVPEPFGFAPPAGDPVADVLMRLDCACPLAPGQVAPVPLGDAACACPVAEADRAVVADLMRRHAEAEVKSGRAKYDLLTELIDIDPAWETRIRYDQAELSRLMQTTRTVCPGEYLMTLDQSRATCSFRMRWIATFRRLLAAGVSVDDAFAFYLAESNATMARDKPWAAHELRTFDNAAINIWMPLTYVSVALLVIGFFIVRRIRKNRKVEAQAAPAPALSTAERELLREELEALER